MSLLLVIIYSVCMAFSTPAGVRYTVSITFVRYPIYLHLFQCLYKPILRTIPVSVNYYASIQYLSSLLLALLRATCFNIGMPSCLELAGGGISICFVIVTGRETHKCMCQRIWKFILQHPHFTAGTLSPFYIIKKVLSKPASVTP
jgi:hypothetical protein